MENVPADNVRSIGVAPLPITVKDCCLVLLQFCRRPDLHSQKGAALSELVDDAGHEAGRIVVHPPFEELSVRLDQPQMASGKGKERYSISGMNSATASPAAGRYEKAGSLLAPGFPM